jgi:integrase
LSIEITVSTWTRSRRRRLSLWHRIRRTSATHVAARSSIAAASMLLGHTSEYVTERYIDRRQLPKRDVTAILPDLSEG